MSEYRLDFSINAGSPEPIRRIADAVAQAEKAGVRATTSMQTYDRANDKLSKTIGELQSRFAALNPQIKSVDESTGKATGTAERYTRSVNAMAEAHRRTVTDVQAASAAIRGLEGHLSIRAVEQFTVKMLGLGNVMQTVFPIVGGLAFLSVIDQMAHKVADLAEAWVPYLRAQKDTLSTMKAILSEQDKLSRVQSKNQLDRIEYEAESRQKGSGRQARLRAEADLLNRDIINPSIEGYNLEDVNAKIAKERARIANVRPVPRVSGGFGALSGDNFTAPDTTTLDNLLRVEGFLVNKQRATATEAGTLRLHADDIDRDRRAANLKAFNSAGRGISSLEDAARYSQLYPKDFAQVLTQRDTYLRGIEENESLTPSQRAALARRGTAYYTQQLGLAAQKYGNEYNAGQRTLDRLVTQSSTGYLSGGVRENVGIYLREQRDNLATDERVENIEAGSVRSGIMARATRQGRLAKYSFGPGDEMAAINSAYRERLNLAQTLKSLEDEAARKELDVNEQRVALAKSAADYRKIEQEAALEREEKILELRKQQQEAFAHTVEGGFRALASGGGRGLANFARGQITNIGATIAGNAGRMVYSRVAGSLNIPGVTADSTLGKLLKGTPFIGQDPGSKLLTAGDSLQTAAEKLVGAAGVIGGGGTAAGGGGLFAGGLTAAQMLGLPPSVAAMLGPGGTSGFAGPLGKIFGGGATSGFFSGASSLLSGNAWNVLRGRDFSVETSHGTDTASNTGQLSRSAQIGAGVAIGATALAGGVTAYRAFSRGNTFGGIGAIAGTAAALDPEPISKAILTAASTVISLFGGDPKERRSNQINKIIGNSKFYDPVALNVVGGAAGGGLADYDRFGNLRGSDISPYPTTEAPYMDYRNNTYVPGRVVSGSGGPGPGLGVTVVNNFNAIDAKSIIDRHQDIADAVSAALDRGSAGTALTDRLRERL